MAGFLQGGGVGKSLAEWMIHGEPEEDIFGMDVARFGSFAENREYIRQMTGQFYSRRFVMTYPNEQLRAGRPLRMAPRLRRHDGRRSPLGQFLGPRGPDLFRARRSFRRPRRCGAPTPSTSSARSAGRCGRAWAFSTSRASRATRSPGPAPNGGSTICSPAACPRPGRIRLAPMLGHDGRLKGDLTLLNWGDGTWWIMGSYYLRAWHMRWFNQHLTEGVSVRDISDGVVGFSLVGTQIPRLAAAGDRRRRLPAAMPFMSCRLLDVGLIRARVGRISVTGELGFEIHCSAAEHVALRRLLVEAGPDLGAIEYGYNALLSLRMEKSFGIWSAEFRQEYTPGMTGLDRWIDWSKDFIGAEAAGKERETDSASRKLVTLEVDATDADGSGYEPVWKEGKRVGFITSGEYGHIRRQEPGDGTGRSGICRARHGIVGSPGGRGAPGPGDSPISLRSRRYSHALWVIFVHERTRRVTTPSSSVPGSSAPTSASSCRRRATRPSTSTNSPPPATDRPPTPAPS